MWLGMEVQYSDQWGIKAAVVSRVSCCGTLMTERTRPEVASSLEQK